MIVVQHLTSRLAVVVVDSMTPSEHESDREDVDDDCNRSGGKNDGAVEYSGGRAKLERSIPINLKHKSFVRTRRNTLFISSRRCATMALRGPLMA